MEHTPPFQHFYAIANLSYEGYSVTSLPPPLRKKGGGLEIPSKPPRTWETPICAHEITCPSMFFPVGTGQDHLSIYFMLKLGKIAVVDILSWLLKSNGKSKSFLGIFHRFIVKSVCKTSQPDCAPFLRIYPHNTSISHHLL